MSLTQSTPSSKDPARRPASSAWLPALSPQWLARISLILAFLVAACAVALLAQHMMAVQLERDSAADAAALEQVAQQHVALLQIGRAAATLATPAADPSGDVGAPAPLPAATAQAADALGLLLSNAGEQALALDSLLAPRLADGGQQLQAQAQTQTHAQAQAQVQVQVQALSQALAHWQAVRERIWYRGQLLLRSVGQADAAATAAASADVQHDTDAAVSAVQSLNQSLRAAALQRSEALKRKTRMVTAAALVLLGLLALAVLEPAARMVQVRSRRRDQQVTERQRLSLVAEHTQAMVIITDREDRIQWVNEAFTLLTGWTLAESLGRLPRELLGRVSAAVGPGGTGGTGGTGGAGAAGTAGNVDLLDRALARGQGARVEAPLRTRDGSLLWVDVDLRALRDATGALSGFVSVSTDITERMQRG